ncbi:MAG TPA: AAA family ATPase [Myxococcota bacterium]|nr:AAA family ATPase [Myxococcota bacterium]
MRSLGPTRGAASVLIVGVDKGGMGSLRETLGAEAVLPVSSIEYAAAYEATRKSKPNVLIVGFDSDFEEAVRLGAEITSDFPHTTLVALSRGSDPNRIRAAMRSGYREYVVLPEDAELLRHAVHEAVYSSTMDDEDRGEVIAICGAKGGCGVTSLTINLAAELSPIHRVVAIDLNFSMGDVASFLDLSPKRNIEDVLRDLERLDGRMLAGSVAVHKSKTHILAQPNEIDEREEVKGDAILRMLQICAESYQYCLIDCGVSLDEATLTTITVSDLVLLVTNADVPAVKNAWRRLQLFERIGIDKERIRLIVNRYDKKAQLALPDIEQNLGMRVAARVQNDWKTLAQSVNEGRLVRDVNKRSPAARDYSNMVTIVTDHEESIDQTEKERGSALNWLFN